jgi:RNA polymerase sigma-70 factor (ECF subfamily)
MESPARSALVENDRRLYGYALSLAGDPDVAADLFQECALRALSAKQVPAAPQACRAWLFVILRNLWCDRLRKERVVFDDCANRTISAAAVIPEQQYLDSISVRVAMAQLSPVLRDTLALVDVVGFRYAEAAKILGIPTGTVMSRMSEARRKMAALIAQENPNVIEHPSVRKQRT